MLTGGARNIMFFLEFLRHPSKTGAIVGSSRWLAEAIVHAAQLHAGQQVLELGPGSGAFTPYILNAIGSPDNYVALELNPDFVARLQTKFPQARVILTDASEYNLRAYTTTAGKFDAVVSGLPWAAFSRAYQEKILDNMLPALTPQATFVTFAYLGLHLKKAGQQFRHVLTSRFQQVTTTRTTWLNLPPAFVYIARGPLSR